MANQENLDILKRGVEIWNHWRSLHPDITPDLSNIYFPAIEPALEIILVEANLSGVKLMNANLQGTNLSGADLSKANLVGVALSGANLSGANLMATNLVGANLSNANLCSAKIVGTYFRETTLTGADFSQAMMLLAVFSEVDLSLAKGLVHVDHQGPSTIGIDTIFRSRGNNPEIFLHEAGVPETFISYMRSLVIQPFDFYSCFISYSSKDQVFAERLHNDLQSKGIRCWFAPEDMKIDDKIRVRIDESIRMYDKLLLILSEHSVESNWVEYEVETALAKETNGKPTVLFPIRLDDTVMGSSTSWAAHIKNTRHIGDFTKWKSHNDNQKAFKPLLHDLKAEPKRCL
jgi:hypothetical protein